MKLGKKSKYKPTKKRNCLTCTKNSSCKDPKKKKGYRCTLFKSGDSIPAKENKFLSLVKSSINTEFPVVGDLRIDDRDIPKAKNFFEFCSPDFCDISPDPYAKQFETALNAFAEYCPVCSKKGYVKNIPLDHTKDDILGNVVLLEYGVCPKCGGTRSDFIQQGLLDAVVEIDGLAGQRAGKCLAGDTLVNTKDGFRYIKNICKGHTQGFSDKEIFVVDESGVVKASSKGYVEKPRSTVEIELKDGKSIKGTNNHPIWTLSGWKKLRDIKEGDTIPIYCDQNTWPQKPYSFNDIAKKALCKFKNVHSIKNNWSQSIIGQGRIYYSGTLTPEIARLLGFYTSEGRVGRFEISNQDQNVLTLCEKTLKLLFGSKAVKRGKDYVRGRGLFSALFLSSVLGRRTLDIKSADQYIPSCILKSPKNVVSAYLSALFEGDGSAYDSIIEYVSLSKRLVKEVSCLLSNFGIIHKTFTGRTWASNGSENQVSKKVYYLQVYGPQALKKFRCEIGFISSRKKRKLNDIIKSLEERSLDMPFFYDKYPDTLKGEFLVLISRVQKCLNGKKQPNGKKYGLMTIFGKNNDLGRMYAENVALSRQRVSRYCTLILDYRNLLDENLVESLKGWREQAADYSVYYTSVSKKRLIKKCSVTYDLTVPSGHRFMANGILNHNSAQVAMFGAYNVHCYLKLPNPPQVFELLGNSWLRGTIVALDLSQAKEIWDPMLGYITDSPWFRQYHEMLDYNQRKLGEDIYKLKDTFIEYKHKKLHYQIGTPNKRALRGRTRIWGAVDEIGWFDSNKTDSIKYDADEVYKSLSNSFRTIRSKWFKLIKEGYNDLPPPMFCNISSCATSYDKIVRLVKQNKNNPHAYTFNYATWEVNPNITKDDLAAEFSADSVAAWRDFGSVPPMSASPFISSIDDFKACISKQKSNCFRYEQINVGNRLSVKLSFNWTDRSTPKVLCLDAGKCVSGTSLIPTDAGLMKIEDLYNSFKEGIKVGGSNGNMSCLSCKFNGVKPTVRAVTKSGHVIRATKDHKVLVLNGFNLVWKKLCDLQLGDTVCIPTKKSIRQSKLPLNLSYPQRKSNSKSGEYGIYRCGDKWSVQLSIKGKLTRFGRYATFLEAQRCKMAVMSKQVVKKFHGSTKSIKNPKFMDKNLAFIIGALISEGNFNKYATSIVNSDKKYIKKLAANLYSTFGVKSKLLTRVRKKEYKYKIGTQVLHPKKQLTLLSTSSVILSSWWKDLGLKNEGKNGKTSSHSKVIPWSILQADEESQLAFIASYLEGDGSIRKDRYEISVWSSSSKLLYQFQCLLNAHGIMTNRKRFCIVTASAVDACNLYRKIEPFLVSKHCAIYKGSRKRICNRYGVPATCLCKFIKSRYIRRISRNKHMYKNDMGNSVILGSLRLPKTICYDSFDKGNTKKLLSSLKEISKKEYNKVVALLKLRYWYSPIVSISDCEEERVYDLEMCSASEHSYTANGVIVHNCNNSFSMCLAHKTRNQEEYIIDGFIEIIPTDGKDIDYSDVFDNVILKVIKEMGVVLVVTDGWQNLKIIHDIEKQAKISAVQHKLKYSAFADVKESLLKKRVVIPRTEMGTDSIPIAGEKEYPMGFMLKPISHFIFQILTVQDNGRGVDKGTNTTDDNFRAFVLCMKFLLDPDYSKKLEGVVKAVESSALGAIAGAGGSGAASGTISTNDGKGIGSRATGMSGGGRSPMGSLSGR